ncbi:MAG: hypothetical protein D4S02_15405 [Rhodocyclaceae bacterium]|nr:MAG: hypothetical protein D4S02_15405 [Rhodocyclaceae bacterium]
MSNNSATTIVITAKDDTKEAFAAVQSSLGGLSSVYTKLLGVVGGTGIAAGLIASIRSSIDLGDHVNALSQKVGINAQNLATWTLAADQSGASIESVAKGVKGLSQFMVANSAVLAKVGVDAKDSNGALIQLADLFEAMPDGVQKTALAVKIFGKFGMEMIPMLNMGSAALKETAEKSAEYGRRMVLLAPLAHKYNDELAEMSLHSKETGMSIATHFLPGLTGIAMLLNDIRVGGSRAERALDWLGEKNLGYKIAVEEIRVGQRGLALAGVGGDQSKRTSTGTIGGPGPDWPAFDSATAIYLKERAALQKANELLGKEANDRESAYLANLRQQLTVASGDVSEFSRQLLNVGQGPAKEFSKGTKDSALALAKEIDVLKASAQAHELRAKVLDKIAIADAGAVKTANDFKFKQVQFSDDSANRILELGKTPYEVKQLQALRAVEKDYQEAVKKINEDLAKIGDVELDEEESRRVDEIYRKRTELARTRDAATPAILGSLAAEKTAQDRLNASWEYGANESLRKYGEELVNVAKFTEDVTTRAYHGMEDALTGFVTTGKLEWRALTESIISDMARIEIRQKIMQPFASAGGFSGLFGSGGVGPNPDGSVTSSGSMLGWVKNLFSFDVGTDYVPRDMIAKVHRGERIIPASQNRDGGSQPIIQHIYISTGVQQTVRAEIMNLLPNITQAATAGIAEARMRGGSMAHIFG